MNLLSIVHYAVTWGKEKKKGAAATTLWAGPLRNSNTNGGSCQIANVGKKTISGVIRIHSAEGIVVQEQAFGLDPLRVRALGTSPSVYHIFCEFEYQGSRKATRALLEVEDRVAPAQ